MNQVDFKVHMFALISVLAFSMGAFAQTDPQHPNIILIIADDLGVDYSNGYMNNSLMPTTPTLDQLRANGLTFMNAWTPPTCTPTRANVMSGKHGVKTGVTSAPGNLDLTHTSIFSEIAAQTNNLYTGAVIGKWHISMPADYNHPQQHGIDYYEGIFDSGASDYYNWEKVMNGTDTMETTYATTYFTDQAIDWVNDQSNPWFLWLAHIAPHMPLHEPPSNLYHIANVNTNKQKYVAAIEAMDTEIGRLLSNIPSQVLDNTLIIYIGDNGTPNSLLQAYVQGQGKGSLYQGGIHVPFIVSGPPVTRVNETEDALVHTTDIYATILEATGTDLPGGIYNSLSFLPLLSDENSESRPYNYLEYDNFDLNGWTIRDEQYKLITFIDSTQEFYDLLADPLETNDLIDSLTPAQTTLKAEMEAEAAIIQSDWSCNDLIQNGDEDGIDCGGSFCPACATVDVEEAQKSDISIYPNPSNGIINISGLSTPSYISVLDTQGKLIHQEKVYSTSHSFELKNALGVYILEVQNEQTTERFKLLLTD